MQLQWLKDARNEWSYARVTGFIAIIANLIWRMYMGVGDINTIPAACAGCCGCITGVLLWIFEVWRENKHVDVEINGKKVSAHLGSEK